MQIASHGEEVSYSQSTLDGWWKAMKRVVKTLWQAGHLSREFRERVSGRDGLSGPQIPGSGVRCTRGMTADELAGFLEAAKRYKAGQYAELVTMAYSGMRAGETKRAPLVPVVDDALREHRKRMMSEKHPGIDTGLIFPSDVGTHRYPSSIRKPMRQLSEVIDLGWKASPQNLRRTFVNLMRRAGVTKATRRSIVGHCDDISEEPHFDVPIAEPHEAMDDFVKALDTTK